MERNNGRKNSISNAAIKLSRREARRRRRRKKKEDRNKEEEEEKKTTVKEITLQLSNIVDNFFMLPLDFWKEFPLEEIVAGEGKDIQISVTGQRYLFKVMIHPMSFSLMRK